MFEAISATLKRWAWQVAGKKALMMASGYAIGYLIALLISPAAADLFEKAKAYGVSVQIDPALLKKSLTGLIGMIGSGSFALIPDFIALHKDTNPPSPLLK